MNYALSELEARHHRKELAIMKRMEQLELARRQLGLSWADLGESDNYLRCAEAGTIQPSITVSSLSPEQMQGMLNTKVLLWRLHQGQQRNLHHLPQLAAGQLYLQQHRQQVPGPLVASHILLGRVPLLLGAGGQDHVPRHSLPDAGLVVQIPAWLHHLLLVALICSRGEGLEGI